MRPLRGSAVGLGASWFVAIALLGPLLGSSADASSAYAEHYEGDANLLRDLVGTIAIVVASGMLVWTTSTARRMSQRVAQGATRDLVSGAGLTSASALVVAAGLLATVPLTTAIGNLTDDPGIEVGVQAGIAQAGTVVLLVAALPLAATAVLLARLGRQEGAVPRWIGIAAWVAAVGLLLGASVALLLPFAAWAVALGLTWQIDERIDPPS